MMTPQQIAEMHEPGFRKVWLEHFENLPIDNRIEILVQIIQDIANEDDNLDLWDAAEDIKDGYFY